MAHRIAICELPEAASLYNAVIQGVVISAAHDKAIVGDETGCCLLKTFCPCALTLIRTNDDSREATPKGEKRQLTAPVPSPMKFLRMEETEDEHPLRSQSVPMALSSDESTQ